MNTITGDLAFIPLGGAGEIGMNLNAYRCDGQFLAIDCGIGFGGNDNPEALPVIELDLSKLEVAVLDEADEMLDMCFREDLEEILDATPQTRRTLLFSATMPRPIVALAKRYQKDALRISTVGDERGRALIGLLALLPQARRQAAVVIPIAMAELDETNAALSEAAGKQAVIGEARLAGFRAVLLQN